jgi:hypothetical protein
MGKKQHAKDKLYILHTEWKCVHPPLSIATCDILTRYEHGGFKGDVAGGRLRLPCACTRLHSTASVTCGCRYKTLPFHCCALTLQDFKDAM